MYTQFEAFLPVIKRFIPNKSLTKENLLVDELLIEKEEGLSMYYSPHNEYINNQAIIVIVGITPGWNQMRTAYQQFIKGLAEHKNMDHILKDIKMAASFSGSMRTNLIQMLDECGFHEEIDVHSTSSLFGEKRCLLHTTSVIKYPVFYQGKNYTGHQPSIRGSSLLTRYAHNVFPEELYQIEKQALVIPLGKTVEQVFTQLQKEGKLPERHVYLFGFPHPSGANGHRKKQLEQQKDSLAFTIKEWSREKYL